MLILFLKQNIQIIKQNIPYTKIKENIMLILLHESFL